MRANQLIRELMDLTNRYGDLEVYYDSDGIPMPVSGLCVVPFTPGETGIVIGKWCEDDGINVIDTSST